ncbi:hypothetical protein SAMN05660865_01794 [Caloramator fervidus]|uniref:Uncharacterized protein n=1 Tax=Caloramator fervidus TaxID=29344 RepID=A0A1H5XKC2_9CLOT|nr:hypothetical protein SAMN05660865_01794 [Caloramator fervidus]
MLLNSIISLFSILIQPLDIFFPMEEGLFVPCIPIPFMFNPSHLAPKGPPGFITLFIILKWPFGVGVEGLPTATLYFFIGIPFLYNVSVWVLVFTIIEK